MLLREIEDTEVDKLEPCLASLARHHNIVSENFKGYYPKKPFSNTIETFRTALENGSSHIAVIENNGNIIGFCKADVSGKLDYLIVLPEFRHKGYGRQLMDWAMNLFHQNSCNDIEVKVVDGNNSAIHLYEEYGFKMNAHILRYKEE